MYFNDNDGNNNLLLDLQIKETYKEGLKQLPVSKRPELCSLYLEWLVSRVNHKETMDEVNQVFEEAHKDKWLEEEHYLWWSELFHANQIDILKGGKVRLLCFFPLI